MRCLVLAQGSERLRYLEQALRSAGVDFQYSTQVGGGASLAYADLSAFDGAIGVLTHSVGATVTKGTSAVLVECGIVLGKGLPLLVLTDGARAAPTPLAGVPFVRTQLEDEETLRIHVDLFVRSITSSISADDRGAVEPARDQPRLSTAEVESLLQQVEHARGDSAPGAALENVLFQLLVGLGATTVRGDTEADLGVDFALILPGEEQRLGYVLVQVKTGATTHGALSRALSQLQDVVLMRNASLGLLLFDESPDTVVQEYPLILAMPVERFIRRLHTTSLAELLVQARNEAIHGL